MSRDRRSRPAGRVAEYTSLNQGAAGRDHGTVERPRALPTSWLVEPPPPAPHAERSQSVPLDARAQAEFRNGSRGLFRITPAAAVHSARELLIRLSAPRGCDKDAGAALVRSRPREIAPINGPQLRRLRRHAPPSRAESSSSVALCEETTETGPRVADNVASVCRLHGGSRPSSHRDHSPHSREMSVRIRARGAETKVLVPKRGRVRGSSVRLPLRVKLRARRSLGGGG